MTQNRHSTLLWACHQSLWRDGGLDIVVQLRSESVPLRFCAGEPSPAVVSRPSQGHGGVRVRPCQFQEEGLGSEPRLLAGF